MEILKHYATIFANNKSPQESADAISALLENMRSVRPALVYTKNQYLDAIQNANIIYCYALEKKYIVPPIKEEVTPLSIFKQAPSNVPLQNELEQNINLTQKI